jgi:hypothetical protein
VTAQESEAPRSPSLAEALETISANAVREELPAQSEEPVVLAEVNAGISAEISAEVHQEQTKKPALSKPTQRASQVNVKRVRDVLADRVNVRRVIKKPHRLHRLMRKPLKPMRPRLQTLREQSAPVEAVEVSEAAEIVEAAETVEAVEAVVAIQSAENTTQPAEVVVENTQTPEAAAEAPTDVAAQPSPRRRAPNDPRHKRG